MPIPHAAPLTLQSRALMMLTLLVLAAAPFEGVLEYQLRFGLADGTVKAYVSKLGVRTEAALPFGAGKSEAIVLVKPDAPDTALVWNAEKKEFGPQPQQPTAPRKVTRVEELGEAKVLNLKCNRVRLHDDQQGFTDVCLTKDVLKDAKADAMVTRAQRLEPSALAALEGAGLHGLIIKMSHAVKTGQADLTMELASFKKQPVDPKLFK